MAGDDIQLAFADQCLARILKCLPRKIIGVKQLALLEEIRLWAVNVFRRFRLRVQHTGGETDDAAEFVLYGKRQTATESVVCCFRILFLNGKSRR